MKDISKKEELIEFSMKNSMLIELGSSDRDRDLTLSIYDTTVEVCDNRVFKIEDCDVAINFPCVNESRTKLIRNIHFINCNIKAVSNTPLFFNCGFTNCKIDSSVTSDFSECLFKETEIKIEDRIANLFRFKTSSFEEVTFNGPVGWEYNSKNTYFNDYQHNFYKFGLSKIKSSYMFIGEKKKKINNVYFFRHNGINISAIFFTDRTAVFASRDGIIRVFNIEPALLVSVRTYFLRKMFFMQGLNDSFEMEDFNLMIDASSLKELSYNLKKTVSKEVFDTYHKFLFTSDVADDTSLCYQNKYRSLEFSLRNKFHPGTAGDKKPEDMIRTVVLYSDTDYWVNKSFTGSDLVKITGGYNDSQDEKIRIYTERNQWTRGGSCDTTKKKFCESIGILIEPSDKILVRSTKFLNAQPIRGDHNSGHMLIHEYYGVYNGKIAEPKKEISNPDPYPYSYEEGPGRLLYRAIEPDRDW
jgi:hypothetical protein